MCNCSGAKNGDSKLQICPGMKTTSKRDDGKESCSNKRNHSANIDSKKFILSDEMTEYSLKFLKRQNNIYDYSGKDFDDDKTQ